MRVRTTLLQIVKKNITKRVTVLMTSKLKSVTKRIITLPQLRRMLVVVPPLKSELESMMSMVVDREIKRDNCYCIHHSSFLLVVVLF